MNIIAILINHLITLTICAAVLTTVVFIAYWYLMQAREIIYAKAEAEVRRRIGDDLLYCADWVRQNEDADVIVQAIGTLLESGVVLHGGRLKAEYTRLKATAIK